MSKVRIAILGPTASGKSKLAVAIAKKIDGTVINGDPFQAYKGLPIGTGQPNFDEQERMPHVGYGLLQLSERINPVSFGKMVQVWMQCQRPILVTGSGLYLRGIWGQLTDLPLIPNNVLCRVRCWSKFFGSSLLHNFLSAVDPIRANVLHPNDSFRIERALALYLTTGCPASKLLDGIKREVPNGWQSLLVLPSASNRRLRVATRVTKMLSDGWADEVESLRKKGLEAEIRRLRPIGYESLLDNKDEASTKILRDTQAYAKRQSTFFRNQWPNIPVWDPDKDSLHAAFKLLDITDV